MTRRGSAVTSATTVASRFSLVGCGNELRPRPPAATTTAMRSWLSEMASSVPSRPVVFLGHGVQVNGQAVGQLADGDGHAARAEVVAALDQSAGILRGGTGAAACAPRERCPSAPRRRESRGSPALWALEEPVAPPMPSRPVRPPSRIDYVAGGGAIRGAHGRPGVAPTTAPISMRLAT